MMACAMRIKDGKEKKKLFTSGLIRDFPCDDVTGEQ